jgi:2-polyprenyl-3-methyl-5-hydroxy-6-metoxy-1,4-benzoquinol methylase
MSNRTLDLLVSLGVCDPADVEVFYPRVRDRDDIAVMRCRKSGVMFLSRSDHVTETWYTRRASLSDWTTGSRQEAIRACYDDDSRRAGQFGSHVRNKRWLDVGTGVGGILDLLSSSASRTCAVEPQEGARHALQACGYEVHAAIEELGDSRFDIVTMFHVLEHLPDPLESLRQVAARLDEGGRVVIEVPHARDFLIWTGSDAFRKFTFWSEHLILHTRSSLEAICRAAGLDAVEVSGYQRYPVANHLHWLSTGLPGGHTEWSFLVDDDLDRAYAATLARVDRTDTLIAVAGRRSSQP